MELPKTEKIQNAPKLEHPLHPNDAKARVIAGHAKKNLDIIYNKQTPVIPEGFRVQKANRAGFQLQTPFDGKYADVWIKTGQEVEDEIEKTKFINEANYPGITKIFNMPIFVDPDGQYLTLPFRPGPELSNVEFDNDKDTGRVMIEAEILSKFKAFHKMGLQLTDTKVSMGSNIVVNENTSNEVQQLTTFIDIATLEPSSESPSKLNALQAQTELMYVMNKYMIINQGEPNHLNQVTNRTSNFLSHLMDDESNEIFFDELTDNIELDSFVTAETIKGILQIFKTGFTEANFNIVHQQLYKANQEAEAKFLAECMEDNGEI